MRAQRLVLALLLVMAGSPAFGQSEIAQARLTIWAGFSIATNAINLTVAIGVIYQPSPVRSVASCFVV
jgi:hypothetical protein